MKEWEAAYLAGIIDGEGSITLTNNNEKQLFEEEFFKI